MLLAHPCLTHILQKRRNIRLICTASRQNSEFTNTILHTAAFILFLVLIFCVAFTKSFCVSEPQSLSTEHATCLVYTSTNSLLTGESTLGE